MLWASCSYSEQYIYGSTRNAAFGGLSWSMANVLPQNAGLSVNGVIYQYTAVKELGDPMLVHVQNEKADGNGYIFRTTDDWTAGDGGTINRLVSIDNVPIAAWGDGSIDVEGQGTVEDPNVVYTYSIDPCFNPQASPTCEGYIEPYNPENVDVYSAIDDDAVKGALKETDPDLYDRDNKKKEVKSDEKLEKALRASGEALSVAGGINQEAMLQAMQLVNFSSNYARVMQGGVYKETRSLPTTELPDGNRRGALAQQIKHQQMVDAQYEM